MTLVFVYGTLKRGYRLNDVLRGCELVQPTAVLDMKLRMVDNGGFPYLLPEAKGQSSYYPTGEVYEVTDPELMQRLDQIESAYDRTKAKTICGLNVEFYLAKFQGTAKRLNEMPNRYVQIDKPFAGQVTWGKTPWAGGPVSVTFDNALVQIGDETIDLMREDRPNGLTEAQISVLDAIERNDFTVNVAPDGAVSFTITHAHGDDDIEDDDDRDSDDVEGTE